MTQAAAVSEAGSCLSEDDVLAFAAGQLPSERRELLHAHLDVCEECQQLLNEAVHALASAGRPGEPDAVAWSTLFRPGMVVGERYVIRRFLARGGMGEVYEALDQELHEPVALKTVTSTASDDPSAVRRLKAEVQLARRVSHPNVCRIYDFGTHRATAGSALSFLTMEFVEGESLGVRLRRGGALSVAEATSLARALLRGLAAAHAAGVLHRDFKSDNVMLRRDGARLQPLILDFGLARALDHSGQSSASGRGLVGTFAYMAPEQLEGEPYTTASDLYSFGLVWFEMLTGELPFKTRSSPAMTTLERLTKPVPSPSSKNPLVPSELSAVVLACLRRSPRDRLQTAEAVLARLEALEHAPEPKRKRTLGFVVVLGLSAVAAASASWLHRAGAAAPAPLAVVSARARVQEPPAVPIDATLTLAERAEMAAPPPVPATPPAPKPTALSREGALVKARPKPPAAPKKPAPPSTPEAAHGWENPFARGAAPPSAELGAVLNQPLDGRASTRDSELTKGGR